MPPPSKRRKIPKRGSIKKIRLKNFMSYTNASFEPGRKFNVIVGPNGSGKSTIVTAIHVGLGGDIKLLRRQKDIKDLIKNTAGKDDNAIVTIELHTGESAEDGAVDKIECHIGQHMKTPQYYKNGKRIDIKNLKEWAASCQIQTENLCQFLPQDVVREFPTMKPPQIFNQTLHAVGDSEMLNIHNELKNKQDSLKVKAESLRNKKNTLVDINEQLKIKEIVKNRIEKRERLQEDIDLNFKQCVYLEMNDFLKKIKKNKFSKQKFVEQLEKAKENLELLNKKKEKFEKQKTDLDETNKGLRQKVLDISQKTSTTNTNKAQVLEDKIELKTKQMADMDKKSSSIKSEIKGLKSDLINLESQLKTLDPVRVAEQIDALNVEHVKEQGELHLIDDDIKELRYKINNQNLKSQEIEQKIRDLSSEDGKKLDNLNECNKDAFKGVQWLRANRGMFKGRVHEPIMMVIFLSEYSSFFITPIFVFF